MKICFIIFFNFLFLFTNARQVPKSIYQFKVAGYNGGIIDFSKFKGKKILIVNTPLQGEQDIQYAELEALYIKHKDKLIIIAILDDVFSLPPGSKRRTTPVEHHFNVSFPMAATTFVTGDKMAPVYKWLTNKKYNKLKNTEVRYDFQKYLINEKGKLVAVFEPDRSVASPDIIDAIEK